MSFVSRTGPDVEPVVKACDVLDRLEQTFTPENLDYEFADGVHRFLIHLACGRCTVAISETTFLTQDVDALVETIVATARRTEASRS